MAMEGVSECALVDIVDIDTSHYELDLCALVDQFIEIAHLEGRFDFRGVGSSTGRGSGDGIVAVEREWHVKYTHSRDWVRFVCFVVSVARERLGARAVVVDYGRQFQCLLRGHATTVVSLRDVEKIDCVVCIVLVSNSNLHLERESMDALRARKTTLIVGNMSLF